MSASRCHSALKVDLLCSLHPALYNIAGSQYNCQYHTGVNWSSGTDWYLTDWRISWKSFLHSHNVTVTQKPSSRDQRVTEGQAEGPPYRRLQGSPMWERFDSSGVRSSVIELLTPSFTHAVISSCIASSYFNQKVFEWLWHYQIDRVQEPL